MKLKDALKFISKLPSYFIPVGSIIRNKKNPKDIDLISKKPLSEVKKYFDKYEQYKHAPNEGDKIQTYYVKDNQNRIVINIWYGTKEELPYLILSRSYPKKFNIKVRNGLKKHGYKLTDYGLYDKNGKLIKAKNYKDIFKIINKKKLLNLPYRTPEQEELKK